MNYKGYCPRCKTPLLLDKKLSQADKRDWYRCVRCKYVRSNEWLDKFI